MVTRLKNTIRKENVKRSLHDTKRQRKLYITLGKGDIFKETKNDKTKEERQFLANCVWLPGRTKNDWTRDRRFNESKKTETNKIIYIYIYIYICNARERKAKWHRRRNDTNSHHLWLINYGERTSTSTLSSGYPLLGPSGHVRTYYCIP